METKNRFYVAKGRYGGFASSRYKALTYGKNSISEPVQDIPNDQAHGTYGSLLFDKRWQAKRLEIIARDNGHCAICGNTEKLQVHHRQYHFIKALQRFKAPWDYENHLLVSLCERCHSRGHNKYRIPNVYL